MRDRFEISTGNKKTRRCGEAQFSRRVLSFSVFPSKKTLHQAIPLPRSEVEHPKQKIREILQFILKQKQRPPKRAPA